MDARNRQLFENGIAFLTDACEEWRQLVTAFKLFGDADRADEARTKVAACEDRVRRALNMLNEIEPK